MSGRARYAGTVVAAIGTPIAPYTVEVLDCDADSRRTGERCATCDARYPYAVVVRCGPRTWGLSHGLSGSRADALRELARAAFAVGFAEGRRLKRP